MNWLSLPLSMILMGTSQQAPLPVVLSDLGEASFQAIQSALDLAFPGQAYEFRPVERDDLLTALEGLPGAPAVGLLGYPVPLLIEVERAGRLARLPDPLPLDHEAFRHPGQLYVACWFSPLVFVRGLTSLDHGELEGFTPDWLPERLLELGEGRFQEMLRLQAPESWNALGVLLASLARQAGDDDRADRLLAGLDANKFGPYLRGTPILLSRLEGSSRKVGVATLRQFRRSRGASNGTLAAHDPGGQPVALVYGLAGLEGAAAALVPLLSVLREPDLMIKISILEGLIPVSASIADDLLEPWMLPYMLWFEGNAGQLALDQEQAQQAVKHFQSEIVGSLARKEAIFSEYFDAIGIALMAVFMLWVILHREDRLRSQK